MALEGEKVDSLFVVVADYFACLCLPGNSYLCVNISSNTDPSGSVLIRVTSFPVQLGAPIGAHLVLPLQVLLLHHLVLLHRGRPTTWWLLPVSNERWFHLATVRNGNDQIGGAGVVARQPVRPVLRR